MKRIFLIWLVVAATALIVLVGINYFLDSQQRRSANNSGSTNSSHSFYSNTKGSNNKRLTLTEEWSRGQCRGSGPVVFTHYPMNLSDVAIILPYGLMAGAHVTPIDHMYFSPKDFQSPRDQYPVYAIADGTIVNISHRGSFVGDQQKSRVTDEYRIDVEYNCSFYSYYDLITSLSPRLKELALSGLAQKSSPTNASTDVKGSWTVSERVAIKAGEEIGRIGGQTLDWAVYNTDVKQAYIVPEHYDREIWKVHTDLQAFDYFRPDLQPPLYQLLARQVAPRLGEINYDRDGYLVGNWFKKGTNGYAGSDQARYWDGHLSLTYDYIDPTQIRFSIGNFKGEARQFGVKNNTPDPKSINQASGLVKYELVNYEYFDQSTGRSWRTSDGPVSQPVAKNSPKTIAGVALIQLTADRQLKLELFFDQSASQVTQFTDQAQIYER